MGIVNTEQPLEIRSADAATVTGSSNPHDVSDCKSVDVIIDVSAVTGTAPTMNIKLFNTIISGTASKDVEFQNVPRITNTGTFQTTAEEGLGRNLRVYWEIGGTSPSFTFGASITKHSWRGV